VPSHYDQQDDLNREPFLSTKDWGEVALTGIVKATQLDEILEKRGLNTPAPKATPKVPLKVPLKVPPKVPLTAAQIARAAKQASGVAKRKVAVAGVENLGKVVGGTILKKALVPLDVTLSVIEAAKLVTPEGREDARKMVEEMAKQDIMSRGLMGLAEPVATSAGIVINAKRVGKNRAAAANGESDWEFNQAIAQQFHKKKESFLGMFPKGSQNYRRAKAELFELLREQATRVRDFSGDTATFRFSGSGEEEEVPRYSEGGSSFVQKGSWSKYFMPSKLSGY